ncbi:di-trans,poly-cis-decaprenylcistransferase [Methylobacterium terrae]|uniref:Isoprenyl transferase n=1 Tax=Methylobacterium terrae TaxID=2202827 RepID=A0A2U8WSH7_9HYPH|nr:di-trans,poly-cis-decaprenylcistransferase [Methylobacterium terrae]AWN49255.1 di-trans,poly-cis-decaprenylcistransferase [Methylobacterium terrae]
MQRTSNQEAKLHVGLIMDGNGRWAESRGLPRGVGHEAGVATVRRVAQAAPGEGIGTLTLYAFSSDNWRRPAAEVAGLMGLLRLYLTREVDRLRRDGVRLTVIGRRDRLPAGLAQAIAAAEAATGDGPRLHLRIALDYSARDAILAAARLAAPDATREDFARLVAGDGAPEVDLVIRTSGEQRLSDFLLWESAYAELHFTACPWPDFGEAELAAAMTAFRGRQRRFGGLPAAA